MLKSSGGPWLLGDSISLADLALGPVLYHATITLAEWQPQALKKVLDEIINITIATSDGGDGGGG